MPYTIWDRIIPILVLVVFIGVVVGVPVVVVRSMRRRGEPGLASESPRDDARTRCYQRADAAYSDWLAANPHADPGPEVHIVFHTYSGLFVFASQVEHRERLPAVAAEMLLREFHRFNLTHGLLAHGALFVPVLSYFSLRKQMKRIQRACTN